MSNTRFPRFGRMRRDWEAMRQVVIATYWFLVAVDSDEDTKDRDVWIGRRLRELRAAMAHFQEESEATSISVRDKKPIDLHGIILTPAPQKTVPVLVPVTATNADVSAPSHVRVEVPAPETMKGAEDGFPGEDFPASRGGPC